MKTKTTTMPDRLLRLALLFLLLGAPQPLFARGGGGGGGRGAGGGNGGGRGPGWSGHGCGGGNPCRSGRDSSAESGRCSPRFLRRAQAGGVDLNRVENFIARCAKANIPAEKAEKLLDPVVQAAKEGLPSDLLFEKLEEGLAKRTDPDRLRAVTQKRLETLRRARHLLLSSFDGKTNAPPCLLAQTCYTIESGMPEWALQPVFKESGGRRIGRLVHVLEAGETLRLAGYTPRQVQRFMEECLERGLNRRETVRAARFLIEGRKRKIPFQSLYHQVWSNRVIKTAVPGEAAACKNSCSGGDCPSNNGSKHPAFEENGETNPTRKGGEK